MRQTAATVTVACPCALAQQAGQTSPLTSAHISRVTVATPKCKHRCTEYVIMIIRDYESYEHVVDGTAAVQTQPQRSTTQRSVAKRAAPTAFVTRGPCTTLPLHTTSTVKRLCSLWRRSLGSQLSETRGAAPVGRWDPTSANS